MTSQKSGYVDFTLQLFFSASDQRTNTNGRTKKTL